MQWSHKSPPLDMADGNETINLIVSEGVALMATLEDNGRKTRGSRMTERVLNKTVSSNSGNRHVINITHK